MIGIHHHIIYAVLEWTLGFIHAKKAPASEPHVQFETPHLKTNQPIRKIPGVQSRKLPLDPTKLKVLFSRKDPEATTVPHHDFCSLQSASFHFLSLLGSQ